MHQNCIGVTSHIKDDISVFFSENCWHFTFLLFLSRNTYTSKYEEKKTAKYSYPCTLKYYRTMILLKRFGPQNRFCLFMFRPIALKQLNSLTTIDTFSWLGGPKVTQLAAVRMVPGSIPGYGMDFLCLIFCFVVV